MKPIIVVIDSGIDAMIVENETRDILNKGQYDKCGHGTACAMVIKSIVPTANIISIPLLDESARATSDELEYVLEYCCEVNCHIVNLSLSVSNLHTRKLEKICNQLKTQGKVIVSSVTNRELTSIPANYDTVLGVRGKVFSSPFTYWFNNRREIQLITDMTPVFTDFRLNRYFMFSGNSKAAAVASGLIGSYFSNEFVENSRELIHYMEKKRAKSKRRSQSTNMATKINEQSIDAYYDIRQAVDQLRDNGKVVTTIPEVMEKLNPLFYWDRSNDNCTYRQKPICYIMDNKILSSTEVNMMLTEIDGLASIIISKGTGGVDDEIIQNTKMSNSNDVDVSELDKYSIFYLIPLPRHDVLNKHETAALGTRQTVMQGYTPALEYYSPAYIDKELYMDKADKRRTLYWNPTVQTDENGKAVIECYNNQYSTPLIIQAETLSNDGKLGSVTYSTVAETK